MRAKCSVLTPAKKDEAEKEEGNSNSSGNNKFQSQKSHVAAAAAAAAITVKGNLQRVCVCVWYITRHNIKKLKITMATMNAYTHTLTVIQFVRIISTTTAAASTNNNSEKYTSKSITEEKKQ